MQTRRTAELYGFLRPRRWSRPGYRADLNVIDLDALSHRARRRWSTTCPRAGAG